MKLQRLNQNFVDTQVVHATGIELDIVRYCHDFMLKNYPNFDQTWAHEECAEYLSSGETDELPYFVYEQLRDFMNAVAPFGTYFGSHQGDGTLGFWSIIDFDSVLAGYKGIGPLPYKSSGYKFFENDTDLSSCLAIIDYFLTDSYREVYRYTEFETALTHLYALDVTNDDFNKHLAHTIKGFFVNSLIPLMLPKDFVWRQNERGQWGIYSELPPYRITPGSSDEIETTKLIMESSHIAKLVYVIENKQGQMLLSQKYDNLNWLSDIALHIMTHDHFVPFHDTLEKVSQFSHQEIGDYIANSYHARKWVISNVFWLKYKTDIDNFLGKQDITTLFYGALEHGVDDMIEDEVFSLRESCPVCKDIEYDEESTKWLDKDCDCCGCDRVNAVWLVSSETFYEELEKHGAMLYESDSYYFFLQSDFDGYGDRLLQQAWLTYFSRSVLELLLKTS